MVSRFQRGIEPNCGGSRFGENQKSKFFYLIKKYFYEVKKNFSLHEFFLSWSLCIIRFFFQASKLRNKKVSFYMKLAILLHKAL